MFDKKVDFKQLHIRLSEIQKEQSEILKEYPKPAFSETFYKETREQPEKKKAWIAASKRFDELSDEMTLLCCVINHARDRLHMEKLTKSAQRYGWPEKDTMTMEDQAEFIGDRWQQYILEEPDPEPEVEERPSGKMSLAEAAEKVMS